MRDYAVRKHMTVESSLLQSRVTDWLLRRMPTSGVRRVAPLVAAIASEIGSVREENQDRAVIARGWSSQGQDYSVIAVADGIGGMRDGAQCAAVTIGAFLAAIDERAQAGSGTSEEWISAAAHTANEAVFSQFRGDGGSTLVALLIRPGAPVCWLSVGDSRVYCARGKNLAQVSVDDTIAGQLGKSSDGAESEQSQLLQFIGMGDDLEPHCAELTSEPIDAAVLTTDGVHYLGGAPGWLDMIVYNAPDPGFCVKRLVDLAKWCGGPDNATVAMIALSAEREPEDRPSYPCLEVWDAFGELQILDRGIVGHAHMDRHSPRPMVLSSPTVAPEAQTPERTSPSDKSVLERELPGGGKPRRSKSGRKGKRSTNEQDQTPSASAKGEEPQLHMEFPTKPN